MTDIFAELRDEGPKETRTGLFDELYTDEAKKPDIGRGKAFLKGAEQGVTLNWGDELAGLGKAATAGTPLKDFSAGVLPLGTGYAIGAGRLLAEKVKGRSLSSLITGDAGPASQGYDQEVERRRAEMATAREQYPGTVLAGELTGAVATPIPGAAAVRGASLGARAIRSAPVGAAVGAIAGAGEGDTLADRARGAATGLGFGAAGGAAAPYAIRGAEIAGQGAAALARPITSTVRGLFNPEAEAARRTVGAITRDVRQGSAELTPAEFATARNAGAPVANLDLGGETTRALARSAANTSPEARTALQNLADARFEGQGDRASRFINNLVGGVDTHAAREGLRSQAATVNRPAYARAYRDPNAQSVWDEGFEQIAQAPVVQEAIRGATRTGANRAAVEGFTPVRNPFVADDAGRMVLADPNVRPSLQFWDHVKRNLDDTITRLQRAGENSAARDAQQLRSALVGHLDELIPSYQQARAGAARFFGAEDALTAGENFVRNNMTAAEGARAIAQMSQQERELFRQGFAAALIDDINNTRDRVSVLNKIGQSPEARQKMQFALGQPGYQRTEAFLTVEQAMDRLRGALGNSTTARQLVELGLAGGAAGAVSGDFSPQSLLTGAILYGAVKKGGQRVDERVARRVAEMLTSNDPNVLARGVRMAAGNRQILEAFRSLDQRLARIGGEQGGSAQLLQAGGVSRAQEDQ